MLAESLSISHFDFWAGRFSTTFGKFVCFFAEGTFLMAGGTLLWPRALCLMAGGTFLFLASIFGPGIDFGAGHTFLGRV